MELLVGLLGALIGATAVIGAQFAQGRYSLKVDKEKQLRADVATATRSLLTSLGAQQWLVWKAKHDPTAVGQVDLDGYEQQSQSESERQFSLTSEFGGDALANRPRCLACVADRLFDYDEQIGRAIILFRRDPTAGAAQLGTLAVRILPYHHFVFEQVANVVEGNDVAARYDPENRGSALMTAS